MPAPPAPSTGWRWPRWLDRQLDPRQAAFQPGADAWSNTTGRRWTLLGTPTSTVRVAVDDAGLVWPIGATWAIDWWIGAEDRWRLPAQESTVRQSLVDGEPVVETVVRVPGGDARSRVFAVAGGDGVDTVVWEVEADAPTPFALAWAVRPVTLAGIGHIEEVEVDDGVVAVDGRPVLWLPGRPGRVALAGSGGWAGEDAAEIVLSGRAEVPSGKSHVRSAVGAASGAVVFPVSHRSTISARLVPPPADVPRRRRSRHASPPQPQDPPEVASVVRGWRSLTEAELRLTLPAGPIADVVEAQRRHLTLAAATIVRPSPEAARILVASVEAGAPASARSALAQWFSGEPSRADRDDVAAAATLWALGCCADLGAVDVPGAWLGPVAERVERLARRSARDANPTRPGWLRAGLTAAASLLAAGGEPAAAGRVVGWLSPDERREAPASVTDRPAGIDEQTADELVLRSPLAVEAQEAAAERARRALANGLVSVGDPVVGLSPAATLALARVRRGRGPGLSEDAEGYLAAALAAASSTWTWPELVAPASGLGAAGAGHDPMAAVEAWQVGRAFLVEDAPGTSTLALVPVWPAAWWGAPLEVHGLATRIGKVSFAVRWHGHRPALLWELDPARDPVTITSPGFDPTWTSVEPSGEALFDLPPPESSPGAAPGDQFS